ncbi:hypothetical protein [Kitasatospora cathayae]|uniref:Uncharacterized protein n=1 Tax=Kitasatospora cathayae TaxID=3004092 RepID=A0ABY7QGR7_9ACTN|nr:hypothetical protein [Kitasatospora sp. HUAS 3-15]WBP91994.1 hypothetical protein O1G21_40090 [Kitasatospora sp. HUAS 3-15]
MTDPTGPRRFRVHTDGCEPQDCTLHPDGRMTMELGGRTLVSWLSLEDMLEMNWADSRIEWDPEPATPDTSAAVTPAAQALPMF